jgi:hypothetical protein
MIVEYGRIEEDVEITDDFSMHGLFTGHVRVNCGGNLVLHGMATDSVVVEKGGEATIHGMVTGELINNGDTLNTLNTITGRLIDAAGNTTIEPRASVKGRGT